MGGAIEWISGTSLLDSERNGDSNARSIVGSNACIGTFVGGDHLDEGVHSVASNLISGNDFFSRQVNNVSGFEANVSCFTSKYGGSVDDGDAG